MYMVMWFVFRVKIVSMELISNDKWRKHNENAMWTLRGIKWWRTSHPQVTQSNLQLLSLTSETDKVYFFHVYNPHPPSHKTGLFKSPPLVNVNPYVMHSGLFGCKPLCMHVNSFNTVTQCLPFYIRVRPQNDRFVRCMTEMYIQRMLRVFSEIVERYQGEMLRIGFHHTAKRISPLNRRKASKDPEICLKFELLLLLCQLVI